MDFAITLQTDPPARRVVELAGRAEEQRVLGRRPTTLPQLDDAMVTIKTLAEAGRSRRRPARCVSPGSARAASRWFGGMVGNHVADLVTRYGEGTDIPQALTDYIRGRAGYDYAHHGRAGNPDTDFVPDEVIDRFCVIPAMHPLAAG